MICELCGQRRSKSGMVPTKYYHPGLEKKISICKKCWRRIQEPGSADYRKILEISKSGKHFT